MPYPTKKLGEVLDYEQPGKYIVNSKNYSSEYKIPVLTAGKTFILGNTNEKENIFPSNKLPVIIFDDFTTAIKFVDFPFKVKSSAMKILHAKKDIADVKYLFYAMQTTGLNHATHKRYWISEYSKIEIPLPPLLEQKKIVAKLERVLTKISKAKKLRAEAQKNTNNLLPAELHKIFKEGKKKGWEEKELGKICKISAGGSAPQGKQFFENGKYPFFRTSDVGAVHLSDNLCDVRDYLNDQGIKKLNLFKKGTILFPKSGASTFLNHRVVIGCDGYVASHLATISAGGKINFRYLYDFLTLIDARDIAPNSSYPSLRIVDIGKIKIPLPFLAEQKKIVARLDKLSQQIEKIKKLQAATQNEFTILEQTVLSKAFNG